MTNVTPFKDPTSKLDRNWLVSVISNPEYQCKEMQPGVFRTPLVRLSFTHLIEPRKREEPGKETKYTYESSFILPPEILDKKAFLQPLLQCQHELMSKKFGGSYVNNPKLKKILKEQSSSINSKNNERYSGYNEIGYFLSASEDAAKNKPQITDIYGKPITDKARVQAGFWGFAFVRPYVFDNEKNKGCSLGLKGFCVIAEDEILGGDGAIDMGAATAGLSGLIPPPSNISFDDAGTAGPAFDPFA